MAGADARRPAGRRRAAAVLDRRACFVRLLGPCSIPAFAARLPFALLLALALALTWYATYHLARVRGGAAAALRLRRRGQPVDYARAIADGALLALIATLGLLQLGHETTPELVSSRGRALPLRAGGGAARRAEGRAGRRAAVALAASGAPSIALLLGTVGAVAVRSDAHATVRAFVRGSRRRRRSAPRRPRARCVGGGSGRFQGTARPAACCACSSGSPGRPGCSPSGRSGAGAAPRAAATSWCRSASHDGARRLHGDGRLGPGADAGAAGARGARGVRAADAAARRGVGDRLVLGVLLLDRRGDRLGRLLVGADRHPGQARGQRAAGARLCRALLGDRAGRSRWPARGLAVAGALAHRAQSPSAVEKPGAAGRRRGSVVAAGDDAVAAAARLRAQPAAAGRAHRRARAAWRLHRRAEAAAQPDRGVAVFRRLSRRRTAVAADASGCIYLLVAERTPHDRSGAGGLAASSRRSGVPTDRDEVDRRSSFATGLPVR